MKKLFSILLLMLISVIALPSAPKDSEKSTHYQFTETVVSILQIAVENQSPEWIYTKADKPVLLLYLDAEPIGIATSSILLSNHGLLGGLTINNLAENNHLFNATLIGKTESPTNYALHRKRLCLINTWKFLDRSKNRFIVYRN